MSVYVLTFHVCLCFINVCSFLSCLSLSVCSSILLLFPLMPGEKLHLSGLLLFVSFVLANILLSFLPSPLVFLRRLPSLSFDRNSFHPFFFHLRFPDRFWFLLHVNSQNPVLHRRFDLLGIGAFRESKDAFDSTRGPFDRVPLHRAVR